MRGFKHRVFIGNVRAWGNAYAAHLRCQSVGNVVAVQIQGGNHIVLGWAQQDLLQEGIGNRIFDGDGFARFRVFEFTPWACANFRGAKFVFRQGI